MRAQALRFGDFTLKSGRSSPYFFNARRFDSGMALAALRGGDQGPDRGGVGLLASAHLLAGTGLRAVDAMRSRAADRS